VVGKIPFRDPDSRKLKAQILDQDPEFPKSLDISIELKDLIFKMLCKNPEDRATIYNITHHAWYKGKKFDKEMFGIKE
jgi:serine/threonine protein kinase